MAQIKWNKKDLNIGRENSGVTNLNGIKDGKGGIGQGYQHGSLTKGLVAYYPLDTGSGSKAYDKALNHNGTINGASWNGNGKVGSDSLSFDGQDDYIDVNWSQELKKSFTFTAWVKIGENSDGQNLISFKDSSSNPNLSLRVQASDTNKKPYFKVRDSSGTSVTVYADTDITDNSWHMVTGVINPEKIRMYIDGSQEGEKDSSSLNGKYTVKGNEAIGAGYDGTFNHVNGKIDDFRIYDRALSTPEIKAFYNGGNGIQSKVTPGDTLK